MSVHICSLSTSATDIFADYEKGNWNERYNVYVLTLELRPLKVRIHFSLEQPMGGVLFVVPPGGTLEAMVANIFTHFSKKTVSLL